ncbi:MAG: hypothetical protein ACRD8A_04255 [Candidatus Acidiferrales bacterium]
MGRSEQIRPVLYRIAGVDFVLVSLAAAVLVLKPRDALIVAPVCFVVLLLSNFDMLRGKRRISEPKSREVMVGRSPKFSAYFLTIFCFVGTLYGALLISEGELPRTFAVFLLVPFLLAIHCWRTARRGSRGNPSRQPK